MKNAPQLTIDFACPDGLVNPRLFGAGLHPFISNRRIRDFFGQFQELGFTEVRNHDWALNNPGQRMVDMHFVFPLFHADVDDPHNYCFGPTDEAIRLCYEAGSRVYYRLGTSIEHTKDIHFNIIPPSDPLKFAQACEHIIRHYTEGWANGFHYDMPCWEIWNEPEGNTNMWTGTREQFASFFAEVLAYLKPRFPKLKIGGPANCFFNLDWVPTIVQECEKRHVRPDFYSFHSYHHDLDAVREEFASVRPWMKAHGWGDVELHVNEWHFIRSWAGVHSNLTEESYQHNIHAADGLMGSNSAAYNIAMFSLFHEVGIDAAYYYGCGIGNWGMNYPSGLPNKNYYSLLVARDLFKGYAQFVKVQHDSPNHFALAAVHPEKQEAYLAIADFCSPDMQVQIDLKNLPYTKVLSCTALDDIRNNAPAEAKLEGGRLILEKLQPGSTVFAVRLG